MMPESELKSWTRQDGQVTYLCSTDPKQIQLDAYNAALESDLLWWAKRLGDDVIRRTVENSLCFGLYMLEGAADLSNQEPPRQTMIGFARIVTDYVTFGYLTDVYVLKEHQGKGLGGWMMGCVNERLDTWPDLRGFLLLTTHQPAVKIYQDKLGARDIQQGKTKLLVMEKRGPAAVRDHVF
ncbi:hypothetical protein B0T22DRAFT_10349 [Podospora appendiculata]|uniref:N-acetyltransferase domain-containing protein n=1 Tax=Podospora appendiculata TaxID=314037 RepID=A0AAE1CF89_9PEZI|nr:hypothetical protein B0T22DRAFT_10349 [Podospora appendiculata]